MKALLDRLHPDARITPDPARTLPPWRALRAGSSSTALVWEWYAWRRFLIAACEPNAAQCDVFMAVGTSAVVYPAAGFIERAKKQGAFTVEINPEATPATSTVDLSLRGGAETVLPEIDRQISG